MIKIIITYSLTFFLNLILCCSTYANWSSDITLANNYLFNGLSQTDDNAALQASITWSDEHGIYVGSWVSNVDYPDGTNTELDFYTGYVTSFSKSLSLDVGISQYTYQGSSSSNDLNYSEVYLKWQYVNSYLSMWYSWDYVGSGAGHYIVMFNQVFNLTDNFSILVGYDKSISVDDDKYEWAPGDDDYLHGQVTARLLYQGFNLSLGFNSTDLRGYQDTKVLFTLAKTFDW